MYRVAIGMLLLFTCSDDSVAQSPVKKADARKSIGVISAIGDKFTAQKVGLMVFGNERKHLPIDAWGIDDFVFRKVSALLDKRFSVKRIDYSRGAFAKYENPDPGLFRNPDEELRTVVRQIASSQKCDVYLVVTKSSSQFGTSNQYVSGLGIVEAGGGLMGSNVHLFALSAIRLYDGQSFATLREERASIGQTTFLAIIKGPHRQVDPSWWPASDQAAQNARLRDATLVLVEQSLAMTVPQLFSSK
jgi:hypothetical protein